MDQKAAMPAVAMMEHQRPYMHDGVQPINDTNELVEDAASVNNSQDNMTAIKNNLDQEYDNAGKEYEQILSAENPLDRSKSKQEQAFKQMKPGVKGKGMKGVQRIQMPPYKSGQPIYNKYSKLSNKPPMPKQAIQVVEDGNESGSEGEQHFHKKFRQPQPSIGIGLKQQKRSLQYNANVGDSFRSNPKMSTSPRNSVNLPDSIKGSKRMFDYGDSNFEQVQSLKEQNMQLKGKMARLNLALDRAMSDQTRSKATTQQSDGNAQMGSTMNDHAIIDIQKQAEINKKLNDLLNTKDEAIQKLCEQVIEL